LIKLIFGVGDLKKCVDRNDEEAQQQVVDSEEIDHCPLPLPEVDVRQRGNEKPERGSQQRALLGYLLEFVPLDIRDAASSTHSMIE
jgi:hypothetical protein